MWAQIKLLEEMRDKSISNAEKEHYTALINHSYEFFKKLIYASLDTQSMRANANQIENLLKALKNKKDKTLEDILQEGKYALEMECLRLPKKDFLFADIGPFRRELYKKHIKFIEAGKKYRQRALIAANRVGKTTSALFEIVCHLSGEYPDWWEGRRFYGPVNVWACSETSKFVRDGIQHDLFGPVGAWGTGLLPEHLVVKENISKSSGSISGAIDQVRIPRKDGTFSTLTFKSYEQGRQNFQGAAIHLILLDEEPPQDIYTECLARTMTVDGMIMMTFTPLKGLSELIHSFLPDGFADYVEDEKTSKFLINICWDDVPHLTEEMKAMLLETLPPHEKMARSRGIPYIGTGLVYPVIEDDILVAPFEIPKHWPRWYGMDTGFEHTAAVMMALDRETDTVYIYDEYKSHKQAYEICLMAIKSKVKDWMTGVCDYAGTNQSDGTRIFNLYKKELNVIKAIKDVESGIFECLIRLNSGRLKIFNHCQSTIAELRVYRRGDSGKPIKKNDHLMDSMRYGIVSMSRAAKTFAEANQNNVVKGNFKVINHFR